jgi:outer membrane protease
MKNIYVFPVLVSIFFFSLLVPLRADNRYSFSLSTSFGILYGQSKELVYKYGGDDDTRYSELRWDLKPLYYLGAALDFSRTDPWERWGFFADLSFKYGLPRKTGIIEDRDWLANSGDFLTHYSRHDAYSQDALLSDVSLGFSFPFFGILLLKTGIGFSYMHFSWSARDGFTQYASTTSGGDYKPWHSGLPKTPVSGTGIVYSQYWFIFSPILAVKLKLGSRFFLDLYVALTPMVFCTATDDHLDPSKKVQYKDYLRWGFSHREGIGFAFVPKEKFEVRLDCGFRDISDIRGESYNKNTGSNSSDQFHLSSKDGGAGFFALDAGISAKIRL